MISRVIRLIVTDMSEICCTDRPNFIGKATKSTLPTHQKSVLPVYLIFTDGPKTYQPYTYRHNRNLFLKISTLPTQNEINPENCDSHDIAKLESCLYEGTALMVAGGNSPPTSSISWGIRRHERIFAMLTEARTWTHKRATTTPTRRHMPATHASQHPATDWKRRVKKFSSGWKCNRSVIKI